ncbi:hypothetical protein J2S39_000415 [Corynebacterium guangdongense]|uniref:Pentapeptide repeat-containing protein n=1 Tax=Corynebacterium guangdongense TaxID=1783348 RepID=A0ABU1ZUZ0_9CORY|nr:hypothetical protein [Corynebacterium guangdongense]
MSFTGDTDFWGATFGGRTDFQGVTFGDRADFTGVTFGDRADFTGARFSDYVVFGETEDQFRARQTHEGRQTTNTKSKGAKFEKSPSFDGPSQFTQLPKFKGTQFPTCPTLTDDSEPQDFFAGAILLDEQDIKDNPTP